MAAEATNKNRRFIEWAVGVVIAVAAPGAGADYALNLTEGVTVVSREAYRMHMIMLWVCAIIGTIVFGAIGWSVMHHRKSRGAVAAHFHENTRLEVLWTVIPFFVLVGIAVPATRALIVMEQTGEADITIKATGHQWKWHYEYVNEGISFFSALEARSNEARQTKSGIDPQSVDHYLLNVDNPLVLPAGKKVRFLTTSSDVIHSWWVPALGFKKDAIPGFINEAWARIEEPGVYRGQCAELCGKDHAFMPIVVDAREEEDYKAWVTAMREAQAAESAGAEREWTKEELLAKGAPVYGANCAACHQAGGEGVPGTFKALKGSPIVNGPAEGHMDMVMNGKAGTMMQAFAKQLNDVDLAAVMSYERSSWGNDAGIVQPAQVKAARK